MSITNQISTHITKQISIQLPKKTKDELAIINYGLETLLMNVYKVLIIFLIASWLDILTLAFISFAIGSIIRFFASGVHAKNWWLCLGISSINILATAYVSQFIHISLSLTLSIMLLTVITFYLYAPADTAAKPIINKKKRTFNKWGSIIATGILGALILVLNIPIFLNIYCLNLLFLSFYTLPITYNLFGQTYRNYDNYLKNSPSS